VTGADGVYAFPTAETGSIPDVGFYTAARRALIVDRTQPIPFAPDLDVEVASPSQSPKVIAAKVRRYLAGGTRLVWVVRPEEQQIDVWHPGDGQPSRTPHSGDLLDGELHVDGIMSSASAKLSEALRDGIRVR
jgi:Uma2 family endonuclease